MDRKSFSEQLKEYFESEKGKKEIEEYKKHQDFLQSRKDYYLSWFDSIGPEKRAYYIQKVIDKYESKEYKDRWYNRGYFPPENLFWYIFDYAYKYGKCWRTLSEEVGPGFDSKFVFDNWKVLLYIGQGSIVKIYPLTEEDKIKGPDKWSQRCLSHEYDYEYDYEHEYFETLTNEFA